MFINHNRISNNHKRLQSHWLINNKHISDLRRSVKILEVVGTYVVLKKSIGNGDYTGRCPFCRPLTKNNKHFRVSIKKNIFKCFECGAGGGIYGFIKRFHDIPFDIAFRYIVSKYRPGFKYIATLRGKYKLGRTYKDIMELQNEINHLKRHCKDVQNNNIDEDLPF